MVRPVVSPSSPSSRPAPAAIRLRGVRQNNLKGFDLDIPLGRYVVVTGLSGAGKSSLVFDTLHAEGQRRYVETFSAYTRQFLDLLDKPKVDSIENIRPSIAIEQTNTVKTSRSTVGTMTELTDFAKVWFSHVARLHDPVTGELIEDDTPATIWHKTTTAHPPATTVVIAFRVNRPANLTWPEILQSLQGQSYVRALLPGNADSLPTFTAVRIDELLAHPAPLATTDHLFVAQDRLTLAPDQRARFTEAVETALHFGAGEVHLFSPAEHPASSAPHSSLNDRPSLFRAIGAFSRGLHSPATGQRFRQIGRAHV